MRNIGLEKITHKLAFPSIAARRAVNACVARLAMQNRISTQLDYLPKFLMATHIEQLVHAHNLIIKAL
jgi:hypothetical protein